MIQRLQSLILLLAALCSLIIVFYFPVLHLKIYNSDNYIFLTEQLSFARLSVFLSVGLNIFSIFQFKSRSRQIFVNQISKLLLSIAFIIIIFQKGDLNFAIGLFLFVIPYLLIILANYLIRKDEKLVKSADRIR
tara:strand:- start:3296 stop:3697 length:402 start_codon:yes stop_codon:yes gene_type:complete